MPISMNTRTGAHTRLSMNHVCPDLPAKRIHDRAMSSVVWIETFDNNDSYLGKGSGVLIDKERRLVVTNEHVIRGAADIYVFFPWKDQNGNLNRKEDFLF